MYNEVLKAVIIGTVSGVVVLLMQLLFLPRLEKRKMQFTERWKAKRDAFIEAILLLDRYLASGHLSGPDIPKDYKPTTDKPAQIEINKALVLLILLSDTAEVPNQYMKFLQKGNNSSMTDRGVFIATLRNELYQSKSKLDPNKIPFVI